VKLIEFQSKIIDANNAAFAAQEERSALLERIYELEKQVADFEAWEREKEKYELKELNAGAPAYLPKPGMQDAKTFIAFVQIASSAARSPI
jgi:hypothetical protein